MIFDFFEFQASVIMITHDNYLHSFADRIIELQSEEHLNETYFFISYKYNDL